MRIIVSDTSCIIDLRKVDLLLALFDLPYSIVIPHSLLENELVSLTDGEKDELVARGLDVRDLDGTGVAQAQQYLNDHPALAWNDCLALRMAEEIDDAILLTGDGSLRAVAETKEIEVHGVIWALDEFDDRDVVARPALCNAVQAFLDDPLVYLPPTELHLRLQRYG